ncbi:MAG: beta-lactamase family protein [Alphaproteobacteria bacterium]|nr:beta-lactamase family protein [Alphaproteobacteria bacterium]
MRDPNSDAFQEHVAAHLAEMHVAGASLVLIRDGELAWVGGFGVADAVTRAPVTEDTLFMLASVSKLFTGAALALRVEDGALGWDDPIHPLLPFEVRHPEHPEADITLRMLLRHESGIIDEDEDIWGNYAPGDPEEPLADFLESYLSPGGSRYDAANHFGAAPGERYSYSNVGFALLGYLVERSAEQPFDAFCAERIFEPLGLDAGWFLADVDEARVAHPHGVGGGVYWRMPHYGYPDYPDGQLRISAPDLARFLLAAHPRYGDDLPQLPAAPIVRAAWESGLGWKVYDWGDERAYGHGGSDRGVHTQARIGGDSGDGYVLLTNVRIEGEAEEHHRDCLLRSLRRAAREE